jgi:hypothetical protein
MLKKTITYVDFNGKTVTEDYYFNLTKAEVAEMEVNASTLDSEGKLSGGMQAMLNDVVSSGSGARIIAVFKEIIKKSIGVKSEDGRFFNKSPHVFEEFEMSAAFSEFFIELLSDPDAAADFVKGIMPVDIDADVPTPLPANRDPEALKKTLDELIN